MFFFSARMFSQPKSNYLCPHNLIHHFLAGELPKKDQKNFQLERFPPLFCSKCRKEWNHTSHLVFSFNVSPLHFLLVFPWGFPVIFVGFRSFSDLRKVRKGWSSKRIIFRKVAVQKFWGVCQEEKYGLPKSSMVHLKIMDFSTLESHVTGYHFSDSMLPFVN